MNKRLEAVLAEAVQRRGLALHPHVKAHVMDGLREAVARRATHEELVEEADFLLDIYLGDAWEEAAAEE